MTDLSQEGDLQGSEEEVVMPRRVARLEPVRPPPAAVAQPTGLGLGWVAAVAVAMGGVIALVVLGLGVVGAVVGWAAGAGA
jgi:hypothetical protein